MLKSVSKHHKEWVAVVQKLGGGAYSEDIVQEMYIKLHKYGIKSKIMSDGEVNKYYVYLTLRSILYSYFRERKKIIKFDIDDFEIPEVESKIQEEEDYYEFFLKINKETDTWHWYDKMLFDTYRERKTSIRKIAKETGISWVSIFHTLKNCKRKIKENLSNDYEKIRN